MATSKKSIGAKLSDPTSSAEVTPVSHLAQQAKDEERTTLDTCGLGLGKPLASYDPITQSWKMFGDISLWGDCKLLENLPPSGMTQNGVLYQQPAWEPITGETESLSWPTPTAVTRPMEGNVRLYRAKIAAGEMSEQEAEAILGKSVWKAQGKIKAMWPTPTTQENEHPGATWTSKHRRVAPSGVTHGMNLADAVQKWPTPTVDDSKNVTRKSGAYQSLTRAVHDTSFPNGKLNPTWVEWLMGFPTGWTDLED
jgi:hypothetical protein